MFSQQNYFAWGLSICFTIAQTKILVNAIAKTKNLVKKICHMYQTIKKKWLYT